MISLISYEKSRKLQQAIIGAIRNGLEFYKGNFKREKDDLTEFTCFGTRNSDKKSKFQLSYVCTNLIDELFLNSVSAVAKVRQYVNEEVTIASHLFEDDNKIKVDTTYLSLVGTTMRGTAVLSIMYQWKSD